MYSVHFVQSYYCSPMRTKSLVPVCTKNICHALCTFCTLCTVVLMYSGALTFGAVVPPVAGSTQASVAPTRAPVEAGGGATLAWRTQGL